MSYSILIKKNVIKVLESIPKRTVYKLNEAIQSLKIEPRPFGVKKLKTKEELYRIKVGDYRIIYTINDFVLVIEIIKIGHRKEVYR
mgnify:CR=1 FL=1